ncbi:MAG: magnesium-translocating P-type ATPase [Alphaproteobacteria bacterium PA3]|nr:MAG: magnesium-translocating P-type ATPase [Alphaproteobacteria bacterium PA3]
MSTSVKTNVKPVSPLVAGMSYGTALFCIGFVLGTIRTLLITPTLGREGAVLIELPFMSLTAWILARFLMKRWSIQPNWRERFIVGLAALCVGMGLELALGVILQQQSLGDVVAFMLVQENRLGLLGQLIVFAFPVIQLGILKQSQKQTTEAIEQSPWSTVDLAESFSAVSSSPKGLSTEEANQRQHVSGPNTIEAGGAQSLASLVFDKVREPLSLLLLGAAGLSALSGDIASFGLIVTMVFIGVALDVVQERRASQAALLLRMQVGMREEVMRDGVFVTIPAEQIVPGDIVEVSSGDVVPADGMIISANSLTVNEASLTGEPYPVTKFAAALSTPSIEAKTDHVLYSGVPVVSGTGTFLALRTGRKTQIGQLAEQLRRPAPLGALERGIKAFGFLIVRVTTGLLLVVLIAHTMAGRPFLESLMFALALAVGMTPELLPMVTAVTLSRGAVRMAKRNAIVKRLAAIHDLGAMDVLCTDKTGTLTEAKIAFSQASAFGSGDSTEVLMLAHINASFSHGIESPLDQALRDVIISPSEWHAVAEVPFDFDRRRASVLIGKGDQMLLVTKGAPTEMFEICASFGAVNGSIKPAHSQDIQAARDQVQALGEQGERALAVAWKLMPQDAKTCAIDDERSMTLAGFVSFVDPPKASASSALKELASLGVSAVILTGDSGPVTQRVCAQLGFPIQELVEGDQIAKLDDAGLGAIVRSANVFCRLNPVQKNRVVLALKRAGHVVGYVGDGINDAPSLHDADVGLSVEGAVDVAREAADIILLQPDLAILAEGVREGRRTFSNIMKYIMMAVSSNFGNMLSMAGAALFLPYLPMTALQILLNNLIYDAASTAIPFDSVDAQDVASPRTWDIGHITRFMLVMGPVSSVFDIATFLILIKGFHADETGFHSAWFTESLLTQVLVVLIIRTRHAPWKSKPDRLMVLALIGAALLSFIIPFSPLGRLFGLAAIPLPIVLAILGLTLGYLIAAELAKRVFYRFETGRHFAKPWATPA